MLTHLLQVTTQHTQNVDGVFVVLIVHLVLVVLDVRLNILDQSFGEFRKVINIVQRIQDAVNQTLRQFTNGSHFLLSNQFILGIAEVSRALLNDTLQPVLFHIQTVQSIAEDSIDKYSCQ